MQLIESFIQQAESGGYCQITREGTWRRVFHVHGSVDQNIFFWHLLPFDLTAYRLFFYWVKWNSSSEWMISHSFPFPALQREWETMTLLSISSCQGWDKEEFFTGGQKTEKLWSYWKRLQPTYTLRIVCTPYAFNNMYPLADVAVHKLKHM